LLVAGCGGERASEPAEGTLRALRAAPGEDVGLIAGTSDHAPGLVRYSFLVVRRNGQAVERPRARIWVASTLDGQPFVRSVATRERVGLPGVARTNEEDVPFIYVARLRLRRPGKFWVMAEPVGGRRVQAVGNLVVAPKTKSPALEARAPASRTPTLASAGGDVRRLTTQRPPDRSLLRHSVAGSLAARKPFVVVFATPKFCTSRTCGPVVDVVGRVRRRLDGRGIRFIHVEVFKGNDPARGLNRWVQEWGLPTEPWIFLVGRDGRIKAKFEGSVSVQELSSAVRRTLL